ncbi:MAG: T9SS C-terminal target domain-containing protein, partial [Calditrichaeota bacterium]
PIYLRTASDSIRLVGLPVWPGDTNNDAIVDEADVIRLGQFWSKSGYARQNDDVSWSMKKAVPWEQLKITYADADGNGAVGQSDIRVIGLNWLNTCDGTIATTGKRRAVVTQASPAFLNPVCVTTPDKPNEVMLELRAQGATDLFGISLGLQYGQLDGLRLLSAQPGELFQGDVLNVIKNEPETKTVWLGLSRKQGSAGSQRAGVVARFLFQKVETRGAFGGTDFRIVELGANDSQGNNIRFHLEKPTIGESLVDDASDMPKEYALMQNSPNPFNPETTINYSLPQAGIILLTIYDTLGKHVRTLQAGHMEAGFHSVNWDGKNEMGSPVASGFYFYQLSTSVFKKNMKMLLLR